MSTNTTPYYPDIGKPQRLFSLEKNILRLDPLNPFGYLPDLNLAIASTIVYSIVTAILTVMTIYHRTWFFLVMTIAGFSEVVGYTYRWSLAYYPDERTPYVESEITFTREIFALSSYIIMYCCIVLAPVALALADYLLVGRLIRLVGRQNSIVNPKFVEYGFVVSDLLSICVQSAGAGLITSGKLENIPRGSNVLIGGLGINLVSFCFFAFITLHLHWSISRHNPEFTGRERWMKIFYALYLSMILLIIRSIYRIIEFAMGFRGYLAIHESYFYVFECLLIIFAFALFIPLHPGIWMPAKEEEYLIEIPHEQNFPVSD